MEKNDYFYAFVDDETIEAKSFSSEEDFKKLTRNFSFLKRFNRTDALAAFEVLRDKIKGSSNGENNILDMDEETRFRFAEFDRFSEELHNDSLYIDLINEDKIPFSKNSFPKIDSVSLIKRMRETRAFIGFSRILSSTNTNLNEKKSMLWKNQPDFF